MIRINLLPIKKTKRRSSARRELVSFFILGLLALALLMYLHLTTNSRLKERSGQLTQLQQQLEEDKKSLKSASEQESRRLELEKPLEVLRELQKRRSGPVRVLDELQEILSPPRNREVQLAQAQKNWNVEWDPRRLWLNELIESDGNFALKGSAENADDVAEFMRRLETAEHFSNIQLQVVEADRGSARNDIPRMVNYSLSGTISYAPKETDAATQGNQPGTQQGGENQ